MCSSIVSRLLLFFFFFFSRRYTSAALLLYKYSTSYRYCRNTHSLSSCLHATGGFAGWTKGRHSSVIRMHCVTSEDWTGPYIRISRHLLRCASLLFFFLLLLAQVDSLFSPSSVSEPVVYTDVQAAAQIGSIPGHSGRNNNKQVTETTSSLSLLCIVLNHPAIRTTRNSVSIANQTNRVHSHPLFTPDMCGQTQFLRWTRGVVRRLLIRDSQSAPLLLRPALSSLLIFGSPSITSDGSIRITIDYDRCIRIMTELRPELDFFLSLFLSLSVCSVRLRTGSIKEAFSFSLSLSLRFLWFLFARLRIDYFPSFRFSLFCNLISSTDAAPFGRLVGTDETMPDGKDSWLPFSFSSPYIYTYKYYLFYWLLRTVLLSIACFFFFDVISQKRKQTGRRRDGI